MFLEYGRKLAQNSTQKRTYNHYLTRDLQFIIVIPVKLRFLSTIKSILKLFDQVGLAWHPEETLLIEPLLPNKIHTLLD